MGESITHLYRRVDDDKEYCFNIALTEPLSSEELDCLRLILADGFLIETVSDRPSLTGERVIEVGPRLNFATAWSSNLVSICQATGVNKVVRVERSRRFLVPEGEDLAAFVERSHDRMTECQYFEHSPHLKPVWYPNRSTRSILSRKGRVHYWIFQGFRWMSSTAISTTIILSISRAETPPLSRSWILTMPIPSIQDMGFSRAVK